MTVESLVDNLHETILKYNKNEIPKHLIDYVVDQMEIEWNTRSFPKARRIARIGYIFRNEHKSTEELAIDLMVSTTTILELRRKMGYEFDHGGDRRSSKMRSQSKTFNKKRLEIISYILKHPGMKSTTIALKLRVSLPTVISCFKSLGYKSIKRKWVME